MGTSQPAQKSGRIQGPVGAIYIDNNNSDIQEGIPVLFLHSFGGSIEHWQQQLEYVRQHRQAAAFDFRGHGQSEASDNASYSVEALVKDVEAVMDELGWQRVVLVGHSMGATTALAYADAHPNRAAGLILAGSPGKSDPAQAKQIMAALESEQYPHVMADYMKRILTGARRPTDEIVMRGVQEISRPVSLQIIKGQFDYDPLPAISRIGVPVMIVYADGELELPNALSRQAKHIPSRHIEGTSHWMHMDKGDEFNKVLDEFLSAIK
jgi:pimeloyl-ACP methyl ester carboxylesterase